MAGSRSEFLNFINWMGRQPFKHKIYVPGNHDFYVERDQSIAQILCVERGVMLVIDRTVRVDGVRFYGSPWVPNLREWAFYGNSNWLRTRFSRIPDDVGVLITHGPPHGIGDDVGVHVGSTELLREVVRASPRTHIFGHIHEGYGRHELKVAERTVQMYNVAVCDREYDPINPVTVIDLLD